jgi:hypothetical protein
LQCLNVEQVYSDYKELMEHRKNPNYGRTKCFHCLLSPDGEDPILFGLNRQVAKGLSVVQNTTNNNTAVTTHTRPNESQNKETME